MQDKKSYNKIIWDVEQALLNASVNSKASAPDKAGSSSRQKNYKLSYLAIRQFAECEDYDTGRLRLLLNMVYGWMPRIARINDASLETEIIKGLNLVRHRRPLSAAQLVHLINLGKAYMGSVVGFSKMLHFVSDDTFAIFDSRVLSAFIPFSGSEGDDPLQYKKDIANYRAYLQSNANSVENYIAYNTAMVEYAKAKNVSLRSVEERLFGSITEELAD